MIINHNMSAIFAQRTSKFNNWNITKNMEKLSSGMRINRAGDDASGLAVSEKMRAQIRGLKELKRMPRTASHLSRQQKDIFRNHRIFFRG